MRLAALHTVEVDLTGAHMIDSRGLNFLVHLMKCARDRDAATRIRIRDNNLDRLLRFTRMNEHADIVPA